jgi:hypothetical protein
MLKYNVKLDGNENNSIFMKNLSFQKLVGSLEIYFMYKAYRSLHFYSLLQDDSMLTGILTCSICGALHAFPNVVNVFFVSLCL